MLHNNNKLKIKIMKVTNLVKQNNKEVEALFLLSSELVIEETNNKAILLKNALEVILIDSNQIYFFKDKRFQLDVMYFKFENVDNNCFVLGNFNNGTIF